MTYELTNAGIPIRVAKIGDISRRDVIGAETSKDPLNRTIIGFRVDALPDAIDELKKSGTRAVPERGDIPVARGLSGLGIN